MELLVGDDSAGMIHTTVQVRMQSPVVVPGFQSDVFPALKPTRSEGVGAHLRFRDADAAKEFKAKRKEFSFKR
jgi:hypothetical protein